MDLKSIGDKLGGGYLKFLVALYKFVSGVCSCGRGVGPVFLYLSLISSAVLRFGFVSILLLLLLLFPYLSIISLNLPILISSYFSLPFSLVRFRILSEERERKMT